MGQSVSYNESSQPPTIGASRLFPDNIHRRAQEIKQAAAISYKDFLATIQEVNKITSGFKDINGKTLVFALKKGTDRTFLWRGTVRIKCHKVNGTTGCIESSRLLSMRQYLQLYNEIKRQAATTNLRTNLTSHDRESALTASIIMDEIDCGMASQEDAFGDECCICMDRQAEVILTCSHSYCENCIDTWNVRHKTCPICRAKMNVRDDTWVLTERPDLGEMALETTEYLMGLTDRTGVRTRTERQQVPTSMMSRDSESFTELNPERLEGSARSTGEGSADRPEASNERTIVSNERPEANTDRVETDNVRAESSTERMESSIERTENSNERMESSTELEEGEMGRMEISTERFETVSDRADLTPNQSSTMSENRAAAAIQPETIGHSESQDLNEDSTNAFSCEVVSSANNEHERTSDQLEP